MTRALRPSAETSAWPPAPSGDRMPAAACGSRARAVATSLTACRMAGSVANVRPVPRAWISTSSLAGELTAQPVQDLLGPARLAGVVAGQALGAERLPGHEDHGDQREPAEHGGLAVPGAPSGYALNHGGAGAPPAALIAIRFGFRQY